MKRETRKKIKNIVNIGTAVILVGGIVIPLVLSLINI